MTLLEKRGFKYQTNLGTLARGWGGGQPFCETQRKDVKSHDEELGSRKERYNTKEWSGGNRWGLLPFRKKGRRGWFILAEGKGTSGREHLAKTQGWGEERTVSGIGERPKRRLGKWDQDP